MKFIEKLLAASRRNDSLLCIGLDPDLARMPPAISVVDFNRAIIEATADLVCAYKPNFAFYEALGADGFSILKQTIDAVPEDIPVIGDAKRSDIGNTARAYARAIFEELGCDAVTVNPYLGHDSLAPFLEYRERGIFILCRTSNPGAADFQSLVCDTGKAPRPHHEKAPRPLYEIVAERAGEWNSNGNIGLVVGATAPKELDEIRRLQPEMPLLIPGIGPQGGDLARAVHAGVDAKGERAIINSSRQVLYAGTGRDFAAAAREVAAAIRKAINGCRNQG